MSSRKEQLLSLRSEYMQRLEGTEKHLYRKDEPVSQDFAEQAVEMENEEVVERLDAEAKFELERVNRALDKIETDEYGLCEKCGNEISEARLNVLPQADLCIDCAD